MAEIVNVRYRTDVLEWVDRVATANGLSRARLIELLTIAAREQGWRPTGTARAASSD